MTLSSCIYNVILILRQSLNTTQEQDTGYLRLSRVITFENYKYKVSISNDYRYIIIKKIAFSKDRNRTTIDYLKQQKLCEIRVNLRVI